MSLIYKLYVIRSGNYDYLSREMSKHMNRQFPKEIQLSIHMKKWIWNTYWYILKSSLKYLLFKYEAVVFLQETILPKTQKPRIRSPLQGLESNIFISKISDSKIFLLKSTLQKYTVLLYLKYPISLFFKNKLNYDASKRGFWWHNGTVHSSIHG